MATPITLSIAARYLRGRRRSVLLARTARSALISILLGVVAMVIAMALMAGYTEDLQRKLIGGSAAIVAYPHLSDDVAQEDVDRVEALDEVTSVERVSYGQGSLSRGSDSVTFDIILRGVDPDPARREAERFLTERRRGGEGALLGAELAERLGAAEGDALTLLAIDPETLRFRYHRLWMAGTFETGFAEADGRWVVVDRALVRRLGGRATLMEVVLGDPLATEEALVSVSGALEDRYLVTDWREYNRQLFTALAIQKWVLFGVLGLIVVVSTFNVASSLVVLTRERSREIGVLAALGLKPAQIRQLFVVCGLALGLTGALLGLAVGTGISWIVTEFELISFSDPGIAAIYFISSVPFRVRLLDITAILAFSLSATLVACWIPARRAAALLPSDALRYE